jgi:undecaprenyl-phosphate 4-deoxy-4-formamido-L-arabinose transferase
MNGPWPPSRQNLVGAPDAPGLSIVIPIYNSAATIGELVEALSALEPEGGLEIVLVNDGSPDNSAEVCRVLVEAARVPVVYVEHMRNYGEHNAVLTGLRHASGSHVVTMDDDLQNPPEEVVRLYDHTRLNGFDVVYTRYAAKAHAPWRNLGSRFANWVADLLLDKPRGLYLSSFRCLSEVAARAVASYRGPYPYIDGLLMQVTQRIGSLEVRHLPRAQGESNYNLKRLAGLWLNLVTSFSLAPLRFATLAGALMAIVGGCGAVAVVAEAIFVGTPSGWASVAAATLLIGGLQCLMLGIVGEYVGRTFLSANGKPQSALRTVAVSEPAVNRRAPTRGRAVVSL